MNSHLPKSSTATYSYTPTSAANRKHSSNSNHATKRISSSRGGQQPLTSALVTNHALEYQSKGPIAGYTSATTKASTATI